MENLGGTPAAYPGEKEGNAAFPAPMSGQTAPLEQHQDSHEYDSTTGLENDGSLNPDWRAVWSNLESHSCAVAQPPIKQLCVDEFSSLLKLCHDWNRPDLYHAIEFYNQKLVDTTDSHDIEQYRLLLFGERSSVSLLTNSGADDAKDMILNESWAERLLPLLQTLTVKQEKGTETASIEKVLVEKSREEPTSPRSQTRQNIQCKLEYGPSSLSMNNAGNSESCTKQSCKISQSADRVSLPGYPTVSLADPAVSPTNPSASSTHSQTQLSDESKTWFYGANNSQASASTTPLPMYFIKPVAVESESSTTSPDGKYANGTPTKDAYATSPASHSFKATTGNQKALSHDSQHPPDKSIPSPDYTGLHSTVVNNNPITAFNELYHTPKAYSEIKSGLSQSSSSSTAIIKDKPSPDVSAPAVDCIVSFVVKNSTEFWECCWSIPGHHKRYSRKFSVEKYGYQRAHRMAVKLIQTKSDVFHNPQDKNEGRTVDHFLSASPEQHKKDKLPPKLPDCFLDYSVRDAAPASEKTDPMSHDVKDGNEIDSSRASEALSQSDASKANSALLEAQTLSGQQGRSCAPAVSDSSSDSMEHIDLQLSFNKRPSDDLNDSYESMSGNKGRKLPRMSESDRSAGVEGPTAEVFPKQLRESVIAPERPSDDSGSMSNNTAPHIPGGVKLDMSNYTTSCSNTGRWVASWVVNGRCLQRSFSIALYGHEKAKMLAEAWRRRVVNALSVVRQPLEAYEAPAASKETPYRGRGRPRNAAAPQIIYPINQIYIKVSNRLKSLAAAAGYGSPLGGPSQAKLHGKRAVGGQDILQATNQPFNFSDSMHQDARDEAVNESMLYSTSPSLGHKRRLSKKKEMAYSNQKQGEGTESTSNVHWDAARDSWYVLLPAENGTTKPKYFSATSGHNNAKALALRALRNAETKLLANYYDGGSHGIAYERSRHCWRVTFWIPSKGLRRNKYFNISKHGWGRAKHLAILYRQRVDALNGEEPLDWNGGPILAEFKENPLLRELLERDHPYTMKYKQSSGIFNERLEAKRLHKTGNASPADPVGNNATHDSWIKAEERSNAVSPLKYKQKKSTPMPAGHTRMRGKAATPISSGPSPSPKIWRRTSDPNHPISTVKGVHYSKREKAWVCRWSDVQKQKVVVKSFQISHFGFEKAKAMAESLRLEKEAAGLAKTRGPTDPRILDSNADLNNARNYDSWNVHWIHEGKTYTECFSVENLGAEEAKHAAITFKDSIEEALGVTCTAVGEVDYSAMDSESKGLGFDTTLSTLDMYAVKSEDGMIDASELPADNSAHKLMENTLSKSALQWRSRGTVEYDQLRRDRCIDVLPTGFKHEISSIDERSSSSLSSCQATAEAGYQGNPSQERLLSSSLNSSTLSATSRDLNSSADDSAHLELVSAPMGTDSAAMRDAIAMNAGELSPPKCDFGDLSTQGQLP